MIKELLIMIVIAIVPIVSAAFLVHLLLGSPEPRNDDLEAFIALGVILVISIIIQVFCKLI